MTPSQFQVDLIYLSQVSQQPKSHSAVGLIIDVYSPEPMDVLSLSFWYQIKATVLAPSTLMSVKLDNMYEASSTICLAPGAGLNNVFAFVSSGTW